MVFLRVGGQMIPQKQSASHWNVICVVKKNEMGDEDVTEIDGRCRPELTGVAREAHWQGDI